MAFDQYSRMIRSGREGLAAQRLSSTEKFFVGAMAGGQQATALISSLRVHGSPSLCVGFIRCYVSVAHVSVGFDARPLGRTTCPHEVRWSG